RRPILVPIKGGAKEAAAAAAEAKTSAAEKAQSGQSTIVNDEIGQSLEILKNAKGPVAGFGGNMLKDWAGSEANDLRARLQTIRANIAFDKVSQMRAAS